MGIFRGVGGTGNSTDDGIVDAVTEQAVIATNKAGEALNSANSASSSASSATSSASSASTSATNAATSATAAQTAQTAAETAETNAESSATSASTSASTATTKASEASTSATNAATSETNAATSASTATTKASEAATSATTATTKAGEASTSATNAAASATSASTSASTATTKASEASTSAANAASSYDDFDDRYLGAKSSAPSTDNDGDALVTGALYFDTSSNAMKVWSGSAWQDAYASLSSALIATNNLSDLNNVGTARTNLGLGTAATTASTDYATAAQGTTADNALPKSGGAMTGAITTNSTFDGRNVSADGTKLDGIEASADVTDTTNVVAALSAGTGISLSAGGVIANTAPDQTVALTGAGATSISGTYPNFTITSTDTDTDTTYTAGTGITLTGTEFSLTDTNAKLNLTGGSLTGNLDVTGSVQAIHTDSTTTTMFGYGLEFSRTASYIRPTTDGTQTLYVGASDATLDWDYISLRTSNDDHVQINGNKVYHAGNDGAGSGLDADLLDGYNSAENGASTIHRLASNGYSQLQNWTNIAGSGIYSSTTNSAHFSPNTATTYATWQSSGSKGGYDGILFDDGGDVAIMYDSSGNGGLYRQANGRWHIYHHVGNNCLAIGHSTTSSTYELYVHGDIYATGNITAYSDARIKENVVTIDSALEKVESMRGVYYNKIDDPDKTKEVGFIAQEVNEVIPEAVTYAEDTDQYGVKYANITALLVESVKELSQQVKDLQAEVKELKENGECN